MIDPAGRSPRQGASLADPALSEKAAEAKPVKERRDRCALGTRKPGYSAEEYAGVPWFEGATALSSRVRPSGHSTVVVPEQSTEVLGRDGITVASRRLAGDLLVAEPVVSEN